MDIFSTEKYLPMRRFDQAGNHLYGGGLACTIRPQVAKNLSSSHGKGHVVNNGNTAIAFGYIFQLKHRSPPYVENYVILTAMQSQVDFYIAKVGALSMSEIVRLSHTAALMLKTLGSGHSYGFDIMEITGLPAARSTLRFAAWRTTADCGCMGE